MRKQTDTGSVTYMPVTTGRGLKARSAGLIRKPRTLHQLEGERVESELADKEILPLYFSKYFLWEYIACFFITMMNNRLRRKKNKSSAIRGQSIPISGVLHVWLFYSYLQC